MNKKCNNKTVTMSRRENSRSAGEKTNTLIRPVRSPHYGERAATRVSIFLVNNFLLSSGVSFPRRRPVALIRRKVPPRRGRDLSFGGEENDPNAG